MEDYDKAETTQLLRAHARGDANALGALMPRVYSELRKIAGHYMQNEHPGRSINATGLVHEAYLRLIDSGNVDWRCRAHFMALSAQTMRRILLDRARQRASLKRGGGSPLQIDAVDLDQVADATSVRARELILLDDALEALTLVDPRRARVVELRFFGGLSVHETADVLGVSADTVVRDWKLARAWLLTQIRETHRRSTDGDHIKTRQD